MGIRFQYTNELNKMGAKITAQEKQLYLKEVNKLVGAQSMQLTFVLVLHF